MVKNLPAKQETQVGFLDQEDPQEKEMATHSSILVWRILQTEEPGGLRSMGSQRVGHELKRLTLLFTSTWPHTGLCVLIRSPPCSRKN